MVTAAWMSHVAAVTVTMSHVAAVTDEAWRPPRCFLDESRGRYDCDCDEAWRPPRCFCGVQFSAYSEERDRDGGRERELETKISLMVSVDVKRHVYFLTFLLPYLLTYLHPNPSDCFLLLSLTNTAELAVRNDQ